MENKFQKLVLGLQHIGLPTNDIEKTKAFYQTLGFQCVYETVIEATNEKVAFLRLGNVTVETYENGNAAMAHGAWDHVALDVTDIEAAFEAVREAELPIFEEIQFLPFWENGVKYFIVLGPNGEKVEFNQYL